MVRTIALYRAILNTLVFNTRVMNIRFPYEGEAAEQVATAIASATGSDPLEVMETIHDGWGAFGGVAAWEEEHAALCPRNYRHTAGSCPKELRTEIPLKEVLGEPLKKWLAWHEKGKEVSRLEIF